MAKLLYITCNLKPVELSRSLTVGAEFLNEYQRCNPGDEIHFLDLYRDNIQRIDADVLAGYEKMLSGHPPAALTFDEQRKIVRMCRLVERVILLDKYVPVISTWDPGFPTKLKMYAELKMYMDTIFVPGETHKCLPDRTKELLKNAGKKCLLIRSTSGLNYAKEEDNFLLQLTSVLALLGIEDFMSLDICGPDTIAEVEVVSGEDINKARAVAALF